MNMFIKERKLLWSILALSVIGAIDSLYLTITHFSQSELVCTIVEGCDVVLKSEYSTIGPAPTAMLGIIFYLVVFYVALFALSGKTAFARGHFLVFWATCGFVASLVFLYLQAFVIQAYCQYCLLSLLTSTAIFLLAMYTRHLSSPRFSSEI